MMKICNIYTLLFLAAALLMATGAAYAEDNTPSGGEPSAEGPREGGPRNFGGQGDGQGEGQGHGKMFAEADTDKDGFLSKAELKAQQEKRFDEIFSASDTDNDGKLSPEEAKKGREIMRAKFKERMGQMREKGGNGGGFKKRQGLGGQETE